MGPFAMTVTPVVRMLDLVGGITVCTALLAGLLSVYLVKLVEAKTIA
jgi:hypothetical protein